MILMKLGILTTIILGGGLAFGRDVHVNGYMKSNGTYVQPYERTTPDSTLLNNYSTKGNVNPYTGKEGTVDPYGSRNNGWKPSNMNNSDSNED